MATSVPIDDPSDPRVADYVGMTDGELQRAGDVFVCEGRLVLERAISNGAALRSALVAASRAPAVAHLLDDVDIPMYVADQPVLDAVAGFPLHRGIVAVAERPPPRQPEELLAGARTVAMLEGVNNHENLGVLFRNAAAFGVDAVLLDPTCADPHYRRTVRVSLGHVLAVPFARLVDWPNDLGLARRAGLIVAALTPSGDHDIDELDHLDRVCFVLGAEGPGLSEAALAAADLRVRIPLATGIDSLNVATAAAIAFHRRFTG